MVKTWAATIAVLPLAALTTGPFVAIDLERDFRPPAAVNNPDVPRELIDALPHVIQQDPDVIIDPELVLGPIVYPDGTPVEGQDAATTREARARCGGTATLPPSSGVRRAGGLHRVGQPRVQAGYAWGVQDASKSVCVQGRGFTVSGTRTWYSIGCGKSNAGTSVTWGNVLSNPSIRAMATSARATRWMVDLNRGQLVPIPGRDSCLAPPARRRPRCGW